MLHLLFGLAFEPRNHLFEQCNDVFTISTVGDKVATCIPFLHLSEWINQQNESYQPELPFLPVERYIQNASEFVQAPVESRLELANRQVLSQRFL